MEALAAFLADKTAAKIDAIKPISAVTTGMTIVDNVLRVFACIACLFWAG